MSVDDSALLPGAFGLGTFEADGDIFTGALIGDRVHDIRALIGRDATILELAGINIASTQPATNPIDAKSLLPILKNQADGTRYGCSEQSGSTLTAAQSGRAVINAAIRAVRLSKKERVSWKEIQG